MKKVLFFLSLAAVLAAPTIDVTAQSNYAFITGTACVGSTLTLNSSSLPSKIVWVKNNIIHVDSSFLTWQPGAVTVAGNFFGLAGSAANQLSLSGGVFADTVGNIYVCDELNSRIQKWPAGSTAGSTVAGGNAQGSSANQLNMPAGVFVDKNGNVFIADAGNNRVQKWAPSATTGVTVAGGNGAGAGANHLNGPTGVSVDGNGNIYIADAANNRVQKWAAAATTGSTVAGGNGQGVGANQLSNPKGIYLDAGGNLYIADANNNRIQKWAAAATSGTTVAGQSNGTFGYLPNELASPSSVTIDGSGNVFVADEGNNRIQEWVVGASAGVTVAGGNGVGLANTQLNAPDGIYLDKLGNIIVSDKNNNRVQLFVPSIADTLMAPSLGSYSAFVTFLNGATITSSGYPVADTFRPSITVPVPTPSTTACAGDTIYFTSSITNGGAFPSYQWLINGVAIPWATNANFSSDTFSNGDMISCVLIPNLACPVIPTDTSIPIGLIVNPVLLPSIVLSTNTSDSICENQSVTFTANALNGGSNPKYIWHLNGSVVPNHTDSLTYTTDTLRNNDTVTCFFISNAPCEAFHNVQSPPVVIHVTRLVTPSIVLSVSPGDSLCINDTVFFSTAIINGGPTPQYQWFDNTYLINDTTDTYSNLASQDSGHVFVCYLVSSLACTTNPLVGSNEVTITTTGLTPFSASITASTTHITQLGQPVTFTASSINGGANLGYQWRKNAINVPNATSVTYIDNTLVNNDQVDCIVHSNSGCVTSQNVLSNLIVISGPSGISNISTLFSTLAVFPNPNKGWFTVTGELTSQSTDHLVTLRLIDILGKEVYNGQAEVNQAAFNMQINLPAEVSEGMYYLRLGTSKGEVIQKILLNK